MTIRIPSEGQSFKIKDLSFEVIKVYGRMFKAKTKSDTFVLFNRGDNFTLLGTKFVVDGLKYHKPNLLIWCKAKK